MKTQRSAPPPGNSKKRTHLGGNPNKNCFSPLRERAEPNSAGPSIARQLDQNESN